MRRPWCLKLCRHKGYQSLLNFTLMSLNVEGHPEIICVVHHALRALKLIGIAFIRQAGSGISFLIKLDVQI